MRIRNRRRTTQTRVLRDTDGRGRPPRGAQNVEYFRNDTLLKWDGDSKRQNGLVCEIKT